MQKSEKIREREVEEIKNESPAATEIIKSIMPNLQKIKEDTFTIKSDDDK
jgi:hypothetical protein